MLAPNTCDLVQIVYLWIKSTRIHQIRSSKHSVSISCTHLYKLYYLQKPNLLLWWLSICVLYNLVFCVSAECHRWSNRDVPGAPHVGRLHYRGWSQGNNEQTEFILNNFAFSLREISFCCLLLHTVNFSVVQSFSQCFLGLLTDKSWIPP